MFYKCLSFHFEYNLHWQMLPIYTKALGGGPQFLGAPRGPETKRLRTTALEKASQPRHSVSRCVDTDLISELH